MKNAEMMGQIIDELNKVAKSYSDIEQTATSRIEEVRAAHFKNLYVRWVKFLSAFPVDNSKPLYGE